jgi:uncharacterized protein (DUF488 family)
MTPPPRIDTIGHSTRTLDELIALLRAHGVGRLVDVRSVPRSRRSPHFDREALPGPLRDAGIAYLHMPGLGGLRKPRRDSANTAWRNDGFRGYADYMETEAFRTSLGALLGLAVESPTAIMCAEAVPWRCHRSLIADALVARAVEVRHILTATRADRHRPTSFARVVGTTVTYPGPSQPSLPLRSGGSAP